MRFESEFETITRSPLQPGHRRDIDALRALAVLAVVLFHAGAPYVPGGFVGVDIFFVISGFVITRSLAMQSATGAFSLLAFYDRRIRRLFPALFVVLLATTAGACALLLPNALVYYARSLVWAALSMSNVGFYRQSGYFDLTSAEKPLLHTWSLAVEEQFYLVWPTVLALLLATRRPRVLMIFILLAIPLSAGYCVWLTHRNPAAAFYLPGARAWELLTGAALVFAPQVEGRGFRNLLSIAGLAALGLSVVLFDNDTPFPGFAAWLPVAGAACQIYANGQGDTFGARVLQNGALVYVGSLSYSFYLWHWPLLAFAHYYLGKAPPLWLSLPLVAAAGALAALSLRYVERPFRVRRPGAAAPARIVGAGVAVSLVAVGFGLVLRETKGLPQRIPEAIVAMQTRLDAEQRQSDLRNNCDLASPAMDDVRPACKFGAPDAPYRVLLWGDSHAEAIAPALRDAAMRRNLAGAQLTFEGCRPLLGVTEVGSDFQDSRSCAEFNRRALAFVRAHRALTTIVLAARWALVTETTRVGAEPGGRRYLIRQPGDARDAPTSRSLFAEGLRQTLAALRAAGGPELNIVLIGQAPEAGFDVPECVARTLYFHRNAQTCAGLDSVFMQERLKVSEDALRRAAAEDTHVQALSLSDSLCDRDLCHVVIDGRPAYKDFQHLDNAILPRIEPKLADLLK